MTTVSDQQLYAALRAAGFDRNGAIRMVAIAHRESGMRIEALADYPNGVGPGYGPEYSVGLFQVNMIAHPQYDANRLATDVMYAAQAAYEISGGGTNFNPWTTNRGLDQGLIANATVAANEVDTAGNTFDLIQSLPMGQGLGGGGETAQWAQDMGVAGAGGGGAPAQVDPVTGLSTDPQVIAFLQAINQDPDGLVRARFPAYAMYLADPELGPILRSAALENWDALRLQSAVQNTTWWHRTSTQQRAWDNIVATDPASAQAQEEKQLLAVAQQFSQIGYTPDPATLSKIVKDSLRNGWDANQITQAIMATLPDTAAGLSPGDIQATMSQLKMSASDYFMPLGDDTAYDWAKRITAGTLTQPAANEMLRGWAKANYAWLAPQIDQGITVKDYFAPMQQAIANIMGQGADSIDLMNDPYWSQITRVSDGNGLTRAPNIADAQRLARNNPAYAGTVDATNRGASAVAGIRRLFQGV